MGRTGITYHEVADAIATLQGKQKNPTVDSIREELGTGSKSTIAKLLKDWKSKNGIPSTDEAGVPNEIHALIRGLWEKLQSNADQKIEAHQHEVEEEINNVKNQLAQTQQQNALLHAEVFTLNEKLNAQTNISNELAIKHHHLENEKIKCNEHITSLETQNLNHKNENERLHQLLKNIQDNLTHYQQAIEKQRQDQQLQIEKERSEYALRLSMLEKEIIQISQEKSSIETKFHLLTDEHKMQKINLAKLEKENMQWQLRNSEQTIENNHLGSQREKLQNEVSAISQSLKENENAYRELAIKVAILENENGALNQKLESDENKIQIMQTNLDQLSHENTSLKRSIKEATV